LTAGNAAAPSQREEDVLLTAACAPLFWVTQNFLYY